MRNCLPARGACGGACPGAAAPAAARASPRSGRRTQSSRACLRGRCRSQPCLHVTTATPTPKPATAPPIAACATFSVHLAAVVLHFASLAAEFSRCLPMGGTAAIARKLGYITSATNAPPSLEAVAGTPRRGPTGADEQLIRGHGLAAVFRYVQRRRPVAIIREGQSEGRCRGTRNAAEALVGISRYQPLHRLLRDVVRVVPVAVSEELCVAASS